MEVKDNNNVIVSNDLNDSEEINKELLNFEPNNDNNNDNNPPKEEKKKKEKKLKYLLLILLLLLLMGIATLPYSYPLLREALPEGTLPETLPIVELIENLYGIDKKQSNDNKTNNEPSNVIKDNSNKIDDAFMQEIKRLTNDLFEEGKKDTLRDILKDLGYDDDYIDSIIDDKDKIIDAIEDKINNNIKKDNIKDALKDLGYDDDYIDSIIDDKNKVIDAIKDKIDKIDNKETIKEVLKDLGYKDDYIDSIIDNKDKILDSITDKVNKSDNSETDIIDIIKNEISKNDTTNNNQSNNNSSSDKTNNNNNNNSNKNENNKDNNSSSTTEIITNKNLIMEFSNVKVLEGSVENTIPQIVDNKIILFNILLPMPGDYYAFTVDIKNNSSIDAQVDNITSTILTEEQAKYLGFSLTYENGTKINKGDVIKSGETKTLKFISLSKIVSELNENDITASYNGQITFIQAE